MSLMLVAPSAIAAASETSTIPRSKTGDAPAFRSAAPRPAVSPAWSAALRSSTAPGVTDQARPAAGDLQGMVPPVMIHGEERSSPGNVCVVTANLPEQGALRS
jgi:hypothetical protein